MRQQYHFRDSSQGLLAWDVLRLVRLVQNIEVYEIALASIEELDEAFWYDLGGAKPTCRNIVEHITLINKADLSYPIILCHEGKVMDGMHRVCKAQLLGLDNIRAVRFSHYIEPDYVGISVDEIAKKTSTT